MTADSIRPDAAARVLAVFDRSPVTYFEQDRELVYLRLENPLPPWPASGWQGKSDTDLLPPEAATTIEQAKREVLADGVARQLELAIGGDRTPVWVRLHLAPDRATDGTVCGVLGLVMDISEERQNVAKVESFRRAFSHRSRNMLAMLQAIATRTARSAPSQEAFVERLQARIQALSRAHDLLAAEDERGATLSSLLAGQVEPYRPEGVAPAALDGEDCYLLRDAALYVGLAMHELAFRAFGASPAATVTVSSVREHAAPDTALHIEWRHAGPAAAASDDDFGRLLLERIVPSAVQGSATLETAEHRLRYALTVAPSCFEAA